MCTPVRRTRGTTLNKRFLRIRNRRLLDSYRVHVTYRNRRQRFERARGAFQILMETKPRGARRKTRFNSSRVRQVVKRRSLSRTWTGGRRGGTGQVRTRGPRWPAGAPWYKLESQNNTLGRARSQTRVNAKNVGFRRNRSPGFSRLPLGSIQF